MIECVANVSEGRDAHVMRRLAEACGSALVDVHADVDHHRSVYTLVGPRTHDAQAASRSLAREVAKRVSIVGHAGVHPYLGALDVVPFVPLTGATSESSVASEAAHSFARWWASAYDVPVFLYGAADPKQRPLPQARLTAFTSRRPDFGPERPHPDLGATAVGVRPPLVAVNCVLLSDEVEIARRIARAVRERDDGLPGVRALGFELVSQRRAQVSMNLVDLDRTGIERACRQVRVLARRERTDVASVELVGLLPRAELERCTDEFLAWSNLDATRTIEGRVGLGPLSLPEGEPEGEVEA